MKTRAKSQTEDMTLENFVPSLQRATEDWSTARRAVEAEPSMENRNEYEVANNELGLAISRWCTEQPELSEQFGFWFKSQGWTD